ncbi:MAG: sulfatase-like hydrolase/transferase [Candidatus Omnitrophota bacterium]
MTNVNSHKKHSARFFFLALGALAACFLSCSCEGKKASFSQRNVLLISIDTCRIDRLEPYGGRQARTPAISMLAQDGVLFEDAVTPVPLTLPAHTSLFTGLHPIQHGVRDNYNNVLSEAAETLPELFQESGYTTAGAIGSILLSRRSGLSQGFGYYDDVFESDAHSNRLAALEKRGSSIVASAEKWLLDYLEQRTQKPFFLFLHFYDAHAPYNPPEPFNELYKNDRYGGEIAYIDDCLGKLFDFIKQARLYDDMLIVLIGDHGEGLGDHKELMHGLFLYEECVRIPFIVKPPKSFRQRLNVRSPQSADLQDVLPTLIELCGLGPTPTSGISLAPWILGNAKPEERWTALETQYPLTYNWSPLFALRNPQWKFVHAPDSELYNLIADPKEKKSVIHDSPEQTQTMQKILEERLISLAKSSPIEPDRRPAVASTEILSSLGYVAGGTSDDSEEKKILPDPKYKVEIHTLIDRGLTEMTRNNSAEAIECFLKAVRQDPRNPSPYYNLGLVYLSMNELNFAAQYTEQALLLAPKSILIHLQMARIFINQGYYEKGRNELHALLENDSKLADAYYQLGWADFMEKKFDSALKQFQEAKKWMPEMQGLDDAIAKAEKQES